MTSSGPKTTVPHEATSLSVIGLGYIGLPTAAMFAASGMQVTGVDVSERVVSAINEGRAHIEEGNLDELVARVVADGRLRASSKPVAADVHIIAVPTPVAHDGDRRPDLAFVRAAGEALASVLRKGDLVILESTSPVGTTAMLAELFAKARPDLVFPSADGADVDVHIAYCPERIIPGRMLEELIANDRIVGGMTPECGRRAAAVYRRFVKGECLMSSDRTAEMVKLAENAYRDTSIAFANELSMICGDLGLDAWEVIKLANRHPRVSILQPGPGVGGHCIAVDPWFIVSSAPDRARLIRTAREVNDAKRDFVIAQLEKHVAGTTHGNILCLGLTYKPDVDDFRESPALSIAQELSRRYPERVLCADPYRAALPAGEADGLNFVDASLAIAEADVVIMLVGHSAFRALEPPKQVKLLDTVGFWS